MSLVDEYRRELSLKRDFIAASNSGLSSTIT